MSLSQSKEQLSSFFVETKEQQQQVQRCYRDRHCYCHCFVKSLNLNLKIDFSLPLLHVVALLLAANEFPLNLRAGARASDSSDI